MVIWAQTAQAREDGGSLLECGVLLGGADLSYRPASDAQRRAARVNLRQWRGGAFETWPDSTLRLPGAAGEESFFGGQKSSRSRLPTVFTVARFGCSWR
tara:strand:+ start:10603 stop:10899 length:297 start_codon:yes stop_codon:yes gene_type:complete